MKKINEVFKNLSFANLDKDGKPRSIFIFLLIALLPYAIDGFRAYQDDRNTKERNSIEMCQEYNRLLTKSIAEKNAYIDELQDRILGLSLMKNGKNIKGYYPIDTTRTQ